MRCSGAAEGGLRGWQVGAGWEGRGVNVADMGPVQGLGPGEFGVGSALRLAVERR